MSKIIQFSSIIIGLGNIGMLYDINKKQVKTHSKALIRNKNFKLVCGIDSNKERLIKFKKEYKTNGYRSIDQYIKNNDFKKIDLVVISVNTNNILSTYNVCVNNFEIKCILIEKPISYNIKDIYFILKDSKKRKINIFVNFPRNTIINKTKFKLIRDNIKNTESKITINYNNGLKNNGFHFLILLFELFGAHVDFKLIEQYSLNNNLDVNVDLFIKYKRAIVNLNYIKEIKSSHIILSIKNKFFTLFWKKNNDLEIKINKIKNKKTIRYKNIMKNYQKEVLENIFNSMNNQKYSLVSLNKYYKEIKIFYKFKNIKMKKNENN